MVRKKHPSTISLLFKMVLRTLKSNFFQFLAILSIGAIAVTLFTGLLSNADVFSTQVQQVYTDGNLADIWVTTKKYDSNDKKQIASFLKDGESIEERLYIPVNGMSHSFYLAVVKELPDISRPYGKNYEESDFVYLDRSIFEETGNTLKVLDDITFSLDISSYKTKEMKSLISLLDFFVKDGGENVFKKEKIDLVTKVTGFMDFPENINKASYQSSVVLMSDSVFKKIIRSLFYDNYKESYIPYMYSFIAPLLNLNSLESETISNPNQYLIKTNSTTDCEELSKRINSYFQSKEENNLLYVTDRDQMPFYITISNDVKQARQFTFVFPMVFFLVAVLVILTTLSQLVLKDRSKIGTLKAMGVKKGLIYFSYILLTDLIILLSLIIGEVLGPILIPFILGQKYHIIYTLPQRQYYFPVLSCLLTAAAFLFLASFVTFLVLHKEVSLKPCESMRPSPVKMKTKEKNLRKRERLSFFSFKMAMRNIWLNKAKSIMVILGVMGCTALLVCGFGIEDTVNYGIQHDIQIFKREDLSLTFSVSKTKEEIQEDILSIDGVKSVESTLSSYCTVYKEDGPMENTTITIIDDDSQIKKVDFDIYSIAVSQKVARKIGVSIGDDISFQLNNDIYEGKVGVVYEAFFYNGIMIHESNPILSDLGKLSYQGAGVFLKDDADEDAVQERLGQIPYVFDCKSKKEWAERIQSVMSGILVMTNAVKVFAILLGVVVLYNLSLMNFKERARDIATLKVLGFSKWEIMKSLLFESMSLTLIGVILGLGLGYPFMLSVLMTNIVELVEYIYKIQILSYVLAFLLTFGVAIFINFILSSKTKSIKMVESLKSVE